MSFTALCRHGVAWNEPCEACRSPTGLVAQLSGVADSESHPNPEGILRRALTEVPGVGPATCERLEKAGILSAERLAAAESAVVKVALGCDAQKAEALIQRARDFIGLVAHKTAVGPPESSDPVNSPSHYRVPGLPECIEVIEALGLDYHLGNALKYIWRAGRKDPAKEAEDLRKAAFYLNRAADLLEGKAGKPGVP